MKNTRKRKGRVPRLARRLAAAAPAMLKVDDVTSGFCATTPSAARSAVVTIYTVERCQPGGGYPRSYGYTLLRTPPHVQGHDDIEGIGRTKITPRVHCFEGWYRRRRDAENRASILNAPGRE
jgi:hypothetical protein